MWYLPVRLRLCDIYLWGLGCVIFTCEVEVVSYLPVRLCDIYLWGWGCVIFTCEVEVVSYLPVRLRLCHIYLWGCGCMRLRMCDIYPWGWGRRGVPPALVWCCPTRCGPRVRPGRTVASSSVPAKSSHLSDTDLLDQQLHIISHKFLTNCPILHYERYYKRHYERHSRQKAIPIMLQENHRFTSITCSERFPIHRHWTRSH